MSAPAPSFPPALHHVLDSFLGPALLVSPTIDIVAANAITDEIYELDAFPGAFSRNLLWRALMDPARRRFYLDFEPGLRNMMGFFRLHYGRHIGEPRFEAIIADLLANSPDFARIWGEHETGSPAAPLVLRIHSTRFGLLAFHSVRLALPELPDYILAVLPPADERTEKVVARVASRRRRG